MPLEIQQEVVELLDGEVRTEVHHRLRREMMRPQYKKDLFFTGSALQLNHTPVPAIPLGDASNVWVSCCGFFHFYLLPSEDASYPPPSLSSVGHS